MARFGPVLKKEMQTQLKECDDDLLKCERLYKKSGLEFFKLDPESMTDKQKQFADDFTLGCKGDCSSLLINTCQACQLRACHKFSTQATTQLKRGYFGAAHDTCYEYSNSVHCALRSQKHMKKFLDAVPAEGKLADDSTRGKRRYLADEGKDTESAESRMNRLGETSEGQRAKLAEWLCERVELQHALKHKIISLGADGKAPVEEVLDYAFGPVDHLPVPK